MFKKKGNYKVIITEFIDYKLYVISLYEFND